MQIPSVSDAVRPCMSVAVIRQRNAFWLPVAATCNMHCRYCPEPEALQGGAVHHRTLSCDAAAGLVDEVFRREGGLERVEIAGPGEPLLHAETYDLLRRLRWRYPDLALSVWTNGLLLPERLGDLVRAGANHLTVSLNAATEETAERIYTWCIYRARRYEGRHAARLLLQQQWNGLTNAVEAGISVSVYAALIPGVNEQEIPMIKEQASSIGAESMTVDPL